jgi:hypothetical protein
LQGRRAGAGIPTVCNDKIFAADGERDVIDCGEGSDRLSADQLDLVRRNCEAVTRQPT